MLLHGEPKPIAAVAARAREVRSLELTLLEGKYHQVKPMVAASGATTSRRCIANEWAATRCQPISRWAPSVGLTPPIWPALRAAPPAA